MRENVTATITGITAGGMKRNYIINRTRVDNKGRVLRTNEFQDKDGRYKYRYYGSNGTLENVYSWRLLPTDEIPVGKRYCESLREKEEIIFANLENIRFLRPKYDVFSRFLTLLSESRANIITEKINPNVINGVFVLGL